MNTFIYSVTFGVILINGPYYMTLCSRTCPVTKQMQVVIDIPVKKGG